MFRYKQRKSIRNPKLYQAGYIVYAFKQCTRVTLNIKESYMFKNVHVLQYMYMHVRRQTQHIEF